MKIILLLSLLICPLIFVHPQMHSDSLALKLFDVMNLKVQYEISLGMLLLEQNSNSVINSEIYRDFIFKYFNYDSLKNDYIKIYTEEFTNDELIGMINFYSSDLGKRIIIKEPIVMARIQRIIDARMQKKFPELDSLLFLEFIRDTTTSFSVQVEESDYPHKQDLDTVNFTAISDYDECIKFHNGKYKMKEDGLGFYFIREGSVQYEISEYLNINSEYTVEWLSDCEYNLIFVKTNNKKLSMFNPGDIINIKIIAVRENEFDCVVDYGNSKNIVTMIKSD
jgi:hypothetical protein